ncbi:MAG: hypothetical protein ACHQYQ_10930, partial [Bacteriovoracales bacterium]
MSRILLIIFFLPSIAFSYQIAFIKESRALIYADPEMKVPIGYLSKGKKIQVGEVKRNDGQVFPLVLSGKIVFIKVGDVILRDQKPEESVTVTTAHLIEDEKEEKDPLEPVRLTANFELMDPGSQWDDLMSLTGGSQSPLYQLEALVEVRLTESPFFFDGGFIYSEIRGGDYTFFGLGFKGLAQFRIVNIELLSLDVNAGFNLAPGGAKLKYNGNYDNGSYYGYIFGAQVRFLPNKPWNINVGLNYNIMA